MPRQYGSKRAGAEGVVYVVQQTLFQNPHNDLFSADASKAYYNLNQDIFMTRLKDNPPGAYNPYSKGKSIAWLLSSHERQGSTALFRDMKKKSREEADALTFSLLYAREAC